MASPRLYTQPRGTQVIDQIRAEEQRRANNKSVGGVTQAPIGYQLGAEGLMGQPYQVAPFQSSGRTHERGGGEIYSKADSEGSMTADDYYRAHNGPIIGNINDLERDQILRSPAYARLQRAQYMQSLPGAMGSVGVPTIPAGSDPYGVNSFGNSIGRAVSGGSPYGASPQSTELGNALYDFTLDPAAGTHSWDDPRQLASQRAVQMQQMAAARAAHDTGYTSTLDHGLTPYGPASNAAGNFTIEGIPKGDWFQGKANDYFEGGPITVGGKTYKPELGTRWNPITQEDGTPHASVPQKSNKLMDFLRHH